MSLRRHFALLLRQRQTLCSLSTELDQIDSFNRCSREVLLNSPCRELAHQNNCVVGRCCNVDVSLGVLLLSPCPHEVVDMSACSSGLYVTQKCSRYLDLGILEYDLEHRFLTPSIGSSCTRVFTSLFLFSLNGCLRRPCGATSSQMSQSSRSQSSLGKIWTSTLRLPASPDGLAFLFPGRSQLLSGHGISRDVFNRSPRRSKPTENYPKHTSCSSLSLRMSWSTQPSPRRFSALVVAGQSQIPATHIWHLDRSWLTGIMWSTVCTLVLARRSSR